MAGSYRDLEDKLELARESRGRDWTWQRGSSSQRPGAERVGSVSEEVKGDR